MPSYDAVQTDCVCDYTQKMRWLNRSISIARDISGIKRFLSSTKSLIRGKACPQSTSEFLSRHQLPFHHRFQKSSLTINPFICSERFQPRKKLLDWSQTPDLKSFETLVRGSISSLGTNGVVVYNHDDQYYLNGLFEDSAKLFKREEIVTFAKLGLACSAQELCERYQLALKNTNLEYLDFLIIEVCEMRVPVSSSLYHMCILRVLD
jgi:hypothetical protein